MLKMKRRRSPTLASVRLVLLSLFMLVRPSAAKDNDVFVCMNCGMVVKDPVDDTAVVEEHDSTNPTCCCSGERYRTQNDKDGSEDTAKIRPDDDVIKLIGGATRKKVKLDENVVCDMCSGSDEDDDELYDNPNADLNTPGIKSEYHPSQALHPNFCDRIQRLATLRNWRNPRRCDIQEAAEAGLYYPGFGENLVCHYFGEGVPSLGSSADAWIEHARTNPSCAFVRSVKGQRFVEMVQEMYTSTSDSDRGDELATPSGEEPHERDAKNCGMNCDKPHDAITNGKARSTECSEASTNGIRAKIQDVRMTDKDFTKNAKGNAKKNKPRSRKRKGSSKNAKGSMTDPESNAVKTENNITNGHAVNHSKCSEPPPSSVEPRHTQNSRNGVDHIANMTQACTISKALHTYPPSSTRVMSSTRPRVPVRQVQAREVRARLDLDSAQNLMKMGFSPELIGAVIAEQMIYEGDDFRSFSDLARAVMRAAELGDKYPVQHYAQCLSESAEKRAEPKPRVGPAPTSMATKSNSPMTLSVGATSWSETAPPSANRVAPPSGGNSNETSAMASGIEIENMRLREKKICKVCFDEDANTVFMPCGHLAVCQGCAQMLTECPLCGQTIVASLKAFLS